MLGKGRSPRPGNDVDVGSGSNGGRGGGGSDGIGGMFSGVDEDEAPKSPPGSNMPACTNGRETWVSRAYVGVAWKDLSLVSWNVSGTYW